MYLIWTAFVAVILLIVRLAVGVVVGIAKFLIWLTGVLLDGITGLFTAGFRRVR